MSTDRQLAAIVLAAGASKRMGSPKALIEIDGGNALEVLSRKLLAAGADHLIVVVGKHARDIVREAHVPEAHFVEHIDWADGRTSSIQAGLAAVPATCAAALIANVDQPLVQAETVDGVVAAWRSSAPDTEVVSPVFGQRHGHPIVVARSLFAEFDALKGAESPRELLRDRRRVDVPVDDTWIIADLTNRSDLQELGMTPTTD